MIQALIEILLPPLTVIFIALALLGRRKPPKPPKPTSPARDASHEAAWQLWFAEDSQEWAAKRRGSNSN